LIPGLPNWLSIPLMILGVIAGTVLVAKTYGSFRNRK